MFNMKEKEEPIIDKKINLWSILAISGLIVVIVGIIFILLSRFLLNGYFDDYFVFTYIISDYLYLQLGNPFEENFVIFFSLAYNSIQSFNTTMLHIGIIMCIIGMGLSLYGCYDDYISRQENE